MRNRTRRMWDLMLTLLFMFSVLGCSQDKTPPVITIMGNNPFNQCVGMPYADPGATAYDDEDGDITGRIQANNPVNTADTGTFRVVYTVSDEAGNDAEATRVVKVIFCK